MCTAKIPPRPCLFLLAALFLLAGCSPQYSMRVISETDGHAYPNDQYTYYIASSKKQNSDPTYQLLKQDVKNTLSETGFTLTQDRNRGTALLSIDYTAKTSSSKRTHLRTENLSLIAQVSQRIWLPKIGRASCRERV